MRGKNIVRLKYYSVRELAIGDKFCLTECEVYTQNGFKKISTLTVQDIILTLNNKTQKSEFNKINEYYKFAIDENIYINDYFECTMNHRVYCTSLPNGDMKLVEAKNLKDNYYINNFSTNF